MSRTGLQSRLVVDAMLGSLSRKLRAFGFDVEYYKRGDDSGIMRLARSERRILVTADRSLSSRSDSLGLPVLLVSGQSDRERVSAMILQGRMKGITLSRGPPRCSVCNGELGRVSVAEAGASLQPAVARSHRWFFRCEDCGQVYWRGGHWKKLRSLERLFQEEP
jgi:uncharacterized protein with PIN domain